MAVDTTRVLEIRGSPAKMIGLVLLAAGMTALGVALMWMGHKEPSLLLLAIGIVAALFFGASTLAIAWRAVSLKGSVVTLTPSGIRDVRVAAREIPWDRVEGISTWSHQGQKIMVLAVAPDVEAGLELTPIARWSRGPNRSLGADGLCVSVQGLEIGYEDLLAASVAYAQAARDRLTA